MACLQTTAILSSSSNCYSLRAVNASIHAPKLPRVSFSVPKAPTRKLQITATTTTPLLEKKNVLTTQIYDGEHNNNNTTTNKSKVNLQQLYAILEAVSDRVEMHHNVAQQRNNWNALLLNSINMITLTATAMAGLAAATSADDVAPLKLSSTLLFSAATGMLLIMNKIQPSQLAEEQRNATRLFKQLQTEIKTKITLGNPTEEDVKVTMEKVLALDKAYPLPLLGAMIEKFPKKFEPAVWWPNTQLKRKSNQRNNKKKIMDEKRSSSVIINGWSEELEVELREVIEVVKRKDIEEYERLGNIALKINKSLAIAGPLLSGIAAVGSSFLGSSSWAGIVPLMAGSLGAAINSLEHGGQVGMVFEMYRSCGGFFKLLEETIESALEESDLEKRENGELFEMKVAMKLGRSVSQLRQLASKSSSYCMEGLAIDEFASKLF